MARRLSVQRMIPVLGAAVLVLGGLCVWLAVRGEGLFSPTPPAERALTQLRAQMGPRAELRYTEAGASPVVLCGYAGIRRPRGRQPAAWIDQPDVAFISRPNRILMSTDPLQAEFRETQKRLCPGFLVNPIPPVP